MTIILRKQAIFPPFSTNPETEKLYSFAENTLK